MTEVESAWLARRLANAERERLLPPPEPFDWKAWRLNRALLAAGLADRWRRFPQRFTQPVDERDGP